MLADAGRPNVSQRSESHLVAVETVALHRRSALYPALGGAEVPAASLTTPSSHPCPDCVTWARGRGRDKDLPRRK
jgi:hypothetical protein